MKQKGDGCVDDCSICRAAQAAEKCGKELTSSELLDAFTEVKRSGKGVVGGDFFNNDSGRR